MGKAPSNRPIDLSARGIRLFACRLTNHDYLWFSSFEISKTVVTLPIIHNYALTYALAGYSYGIYRGSTPRYEEDLAQMTLYTTPAVAEEASRIRLTHNAVNSRTLRTDDAPRGINTPDLGWRVVLNPIYDPEGEEPTRNFRFYCFTFDGRPPRTCFRLGKKGCSMRMNWEELHPAVAVFSEDPVRPTHAVNPLDLVGELVAYEPVSLPPHLLFRRVEVRNVWVIPNGRHRVLLPARVEARIKER